MDECGMWRICSVLLFGEIQSGGFHGRMGSVKFLNKGRRCEPLLRSVFTPSLCSCPLCLRTFIEGSGCSGRKRETVIERRPPRTPANGRTTYDWGLLLKLSQEQRNWAAQE